MECDLASARRVIAYEPNRTTSFTYDASGSVLTDSDPPPTAPTRAPGPLHYNANGHRAGEHRHKDRDGNTTTAYTYDAIRQYRDDVVNALGRTDDL